ncbi:FAD-dependent oxidoreductase [Roseibium suaedae]|uniref:Succinate dehydrogenase/fumarate reductase, flavoprotein subunit n=1 Tax=Roseibium suaedae TaxID=735517 RepID=A0A1M7KPV1_9HYPH|nr:FAD-dependent oxidoreductase [Roseibium suaedae]SHM67349.1 Succinate dehydrogenase/fumarate reductase, flavoprotein subunit [Roseibium suaedae]
MTDNPKVPEDQPSAGTFDLIVAGSGAAGLCAAVTAAFHGLKVCLLEKTDVIGGTTAWSGGWIWAPCNPVGQRAGIVEDTTAPRLYLQSLLGNHFEADRIDAFLAAAPRMVGFLEDNTALEFEGGLAIPDTYSHLPGAGMGGRSVIARPYDARKLGTSLKLLRKPMRETTFFGMTIQAGPDLRAFLTMLRSTASFGHVMKRTLRHFRDLALHGRGMDLRNGNALAARLLRTALDLGVDIRTGAVIDRLITSDGRVLGVALEDGTQLTAERGVVLACGGFSQNPVIRQGIFPRNEDHRSLALQSAAGDGLTLAMSAGAVPKTNLAHPAAYCPVSTVPWENGQSGQFPHIIDRGKPGVIGILASGRRFCNEGLGYHDYVTALLAAVPEEEKAESWLVCDHRFLRRYGLGIVRPSPVPFGAWLRNGYLKTGKTPEELARACGIDPAGLTTTLDTWNRHAATGEDPEYGRGATPYMRLQGDPAQKPNPCVAPIASAPYYAVKVVPGSFGTFAGIATDSSARVLSTDGTPIIGLYAAGADAASVFGGFYPAGGINLGPALTFGYIAGCHAAGKDI